MGRLFLIRHAQASFLSANYDQLSSLGGAQARLLGEFWARRKMTFDVVYTGPALRQRQTAQIAGEALRKIGIPFPEPLIREEFDEFDAQALLTQGLPQLVANNHEVRDLQDAAQSSGNDTKKRAAFQRLFEAVTSAWVDGHLMLHDVEPWPDFCNRVNLDLTNVFASCAKGAKLAIFTSGGPIAVAMQRALHLSAQDTLRVIWMSRNCSWSEFLFSGDRFTLDSFNSHPHLDNDSLLTYR